MVLIKRPLKIIVITLSAFLTLTVIAGVCIGNYFYNIVLDPLSDKSEVLSAPHNTTDSSAENTDGNRSETESWFEENAKDDYIYSFDDLKLHSYIITNENTTNKWVIMCHGYNGNGLTQDKTAPHFYEMGFNIMAPDARGQGESEGNYIGMGWDDRLDVVSHINSILNKNKNAEIILYGVSMGGATVMMASGEELPSNVKAIIEDGGYSSLWEELSYQLKKLYNLPPFPILNFMSLVTKIRAGFTIEETSALKQVAKSTIPILFIHGSGDTFVPPYMMDKLYSAATCPKEKLIVDNAKHGKSSVTAENLYWGTIKNFLGKYIK